MTDNFSSIVPQEGQSPCNQENCCNRTQMNSTLASECCSIQDKYDFSKEKIITLMSVETILIIVTVFGNFLVFKAFHKFSSLRTASNVILLSLCVADSWITIVYILHISLMALKISSIDHRNPWFNYLCMSDAGISFFLLSAIVLHLALISVDRFIAVKFSLRYHAIVTKRRALFASIAVWLWAVFVTIVFPLALRVSSSDTYQRFLQALHPCFKTHRQGPPTGGYPIFLVTSLLVVPLMIILCLYGYIFTVSQKHRKTIKEQAGDIQGISTMKHEMRGARTLAIIVAVCLLSIVPLLVVTSLRLFGKLPECQHSNRHAKYIVYYVGFGLNATCHPLIYVWRNEQFRNAVRKLLRCA